MVATFIVVVYTSNRKQVHTAEQFTHNANCSHHPPSLPSYLTPPSTATVASSPGPQSHASVSPVSVSTTPPGEF